MSVRKTLTSWPQDAICSLRREIPGTVRGPARTPVLRCEERPAHRQPGDEPGLDVIDERCSRRRGKRLELRWASSDSEASKPGETWRIPQPSPSCAFAAATVGYVVSSSWPCVLRLADPMATADLGQAFGSVSKTVAEYRRGQKAARLSADRPSAGRTKTRLASRMETPRSRSNRRRSPNIRSIEQPDTLCSSTAIARNCRAAARAEVTASWRRPPRVAARGSLLLA